MNPASDSASFLVHFQHTFQIFEQTVFSQLRKIPSAVACNMKISKAMINMEQVTATRLKIIDSIKFSERLKINVRVLTE